VVNYTNILGADFVTIFFKFKITNLYVERSYAKHFPTKKAASKMLLKLTPVDVVVVAALPGDLSGSICKRDKS